MKTFFFGGNFRYLQWAERSESSQRFLVCWSFRTLLVSLKNNYIFPPGSGRGGGGAGWPRPLSPLPPGQGQAGPSVVKALHMEMGVGAGSWFSWKINSQQRKTRLTRVFFPWNLEDAYIETGTVFKESKFSNRNVLFPFCCVIWCV